VHLTGTAGGLHALATRLQTAGCAVNLSAPGWLNESRFSGLRATARRSVTPEQPSTALAQGSILGAAAANPAAPLLSARLHPQGDNYLLEISNRGGTPLTHVTLELPADARNWHMFSSVLPAWPIARLNPREHARFPVSISMEGPVVVQAVVSGFSEAGERHSYPVSLSIYG